MTSKDWKWISLTCGLYWFALSMIRPLISLYTLEIGASPVQTGFVLAVYALLPMLIAIPSGGIADVIGHTRLLRLGALLMLLSGFCYLGSGTIWLLAVSQIIAGVGQMFVWLSVQVMIIQQNDEQAHESRLATFSLYMGLGQLAAPIIGGYLSDYFDYRGAFIGHALVCLILVYTAWHCKQVKHDSGRIINMKAMYKKSAAMLMRSSFLAIILSTFIALFILDVRMTYLPVYLEKINISHTQLGILVSIGAMSALLIKPIYPWLIRNLGHTKLLMGSFAVSLCLLFVSPLLEHYISLAVLIFITGVALGINQPLTLSLIADQTLLEERGLGIGLRLMANRASQLFDPLLFGILTTVGGLTFAFWMVGLFLLAVCALVLWLLTRPDEERQCERKGEGRLSPPI